MTSHLRPLETRILAMRDAGLDDVEIGRKVAKSPGRVAQIADWAALPGRGPRPDDGELLRPIERRVLALRSEGRSYDEIGRRLKKSPRFVRQVEGLARFRQYRDLLG